MLFLSFPHKGLVILDRAPEKLVSNIVQLVVQHPSIRQILVIARIILDRELHLEILRTHEQVVGPTLSLSRGPA